MLVIQNTVLLSGEELVHKMQAEEPLPQTFTYYSFIGLDCAATVLSFLVVKQT